MRDRLPFAVNHYLCPASVAVPAFLAQLAGHGFSAVGLTQAALLELPAAALRQQLGEHALRVSSVNTAGFFLEDGEPGRLQAERNTALLRQAAALEGPALNVIVGGSASLSLPQARERAEQRLAAFAREAHSLGVQLLVEPLHFLNVRTKSCFNTIAQMEQLFARIPGLALNADLFHLWWDPDLERLLRGDSVPIGLFQICDVAISEAQPVPRRVPLGEGCVPWASHVRAVRRAFPDVPIELELFADQLPGRRLEDLLSSSAAALGALSED